MRIFKRLTKFRAEAQTGALGLLGLIIPSGIMSESNQDSIIAELQYNKTMKKILIFTALLAIILITLILVRVSNQPSQNIPKTTPAPTQYIPPPLPTIPTNDTLTINGIKVNNIYKDARDRTQAGDVDFSSSPNYSITYLPKYSEFIITIYQLPFEENRILAEKEFIKKLDISQQQACLMTVSISVPFSVDPEQSGIKFPLSFCGR